jgi:small subunit ribosomal protein S16
LSDKKEIKADRVKYWIEKGAQPTDTVHNLLVQAAILTGKKRAVHKKAKVKAEGEKAKAEEPKTEAAK